MKHPPILFLILFSVALRFNSAQAQTTPNVCRAQLFFADINTQGSVITSGNALVFIDDRPMDSGVFTQQPTGDSEAFSIDKSNISEINQRSDTLSVYTKNMVTYRSKAEKHVTLRFTSGNCGVIATWLRVKPPAPPRPKPTPKPGKQPPLIIQAKLRRPMRPDISGDLIISDDLITFGARGKVKYQWGLRGLRDIQQEGACVLRITPFVGGELAFDLQDRCIGTPEFRMIRGRFLR
ncbi:MAG: hypothetical protein ACRD9Y_24835 [Blastocatellia bacterium]